MIPTRMIILGIDPGSQKTGFGLVKKSGNRLTHVENGTFYLKDHKRYSDKLAALHQELSAIIAAFKPEALVVENIFFHKNPKSMQKLAEVRGAVILSGAIAGLTIFEFSPREVKKAVTGYGNASKDQMQLMVKRLLCLSDLAEENASDALALAICHANSCTQISALTNATKTPITAAKEILKRASFYR